MKAVQTFDALSKDFCAYLEQIHRRDGTIKRYDQLWGSVKIFMDPRNMQFYDKQVGEDYLHHSLVTLPIHRSANTLN